MRAIRQQADIVDIMSNYLTLEKKGKNYRAICPFHDDHDPSLSISTDKQIFKCFVCGTGGNVLALLIGVLCLAVSVLIYAPFVIAAGKASQVDDDNSEKDTTEGLA